MLHNQRRRRHNPIDWAAFVQAIVVCLRLPVSVSGIHFEGIGTRHPSFASAEALYDLGTRADVDLFRARDVVHEDPLQAVLRPTMGPRLIPFVPDAPDWQDRDGRGTGV
ncbi:hypothetical protein DWF00_20165 [Bosea caraganae]|uniref:Uncharacterized protein n=1 Tax=Bosea caraganae TaxID=2763117 RepID=A0A370KZ88_9HYPH|nr:hypothetical protein [Bosea caraganae]RDJ20310.1 hypothetical protein DWE98_25455 [Bosea caraganae]RDJ24006.1 hypothetical protein DWF00_20165 [Bosea caraganae]